MKKQLLSHVIHIMSTIPSIIHSGNPRNSFQSSVARFPLAELSDEWLDPCKVWGSYTPKRSSDGTSLQKSCIPSEQEVYEIHLTSFPSGRFLPCAE